MSVARPKGERKTRLLGELLLQQGLISKDQLRIALTEQQKTGEQLGRLLVGLGFVGESVMRDSLGEALGRESIDLSTVVPDVSALQLVPKELARRYSLVPISYSLEERMLTLAMADIYNLIALDRLRAQLGGQVEIKALLAGEGEVEDAIDQFYGYELSVDGILHEVETGEIDHASVQATTGGYSQPLVRLVDAILADAVKREVSDIHFEPEEGFLRIRYRIDGVLRQIRSLHKNYYPAIVVRLKVMAGMNIAETRAPQDGHISLAIGGHQIDFRVSCMPTSHGENIVLRILDRDKGIIPVEALGLPEATLTQLKLIMSRPEGIVLITGPTGSGKTTTLYSMLSDLNSEQINIMTLEDPVEYPMPMIRQTSVNDSIKLSFAGGIRALMRQDPDVILVGEVRDEETAEMAFRAAMTGHQVYSTLHTNSAVGALSRLADIGVTSDIISGNIIGIIAQRLIRKLCAHCKEAYEPDEIICRMIGVQPQDGVQLYRPVGCTRCDHQGFKGRLAVMEVLRLNAEIDELIYKRAGNREIERAALEAGFQTLADDAVRRVKEGLTSIEEVSRVIDLTQRI